MSWSTPSSSPLEPTIAPPCIFLLCFPRTLAANPAYPAVPSRVCARIGHPCSDSVTSAVHPASTCSGTAAVWVWSRLMTVTRTRRPSSSGIAASCGLCDASSSSSLLQSPSSGGSVVSWLPATPSLVRLASAPTSGGSTVSLLCATDNVWSLVSRASWKPGGKAIIWLWSSTNTRRATHWHSSGGSEVRRLEVRVRRCKCTSSATLAGSVKMRLLEASTLCAAPATLGSVKILAGSSRRLASRRPMMPVDFQAASRAAALRFTFCVTAAARPLEPTAAYARPPPGP
mmetsp:Transcript_32349/g.81424  ORF Transcript_32349/g.81424 Transcript_32349/m.81424 type:complete len:286 (+) Transcript_32349:79-936(+)